MVCSVSTAELIAVFLICFLTALAEKFADVYFLVDMGLGQGEFQQVRTLLVRLVNQLNVGESTIRFGLAQYGENVRVEFNFNSHKTKEETLSAVRRFRQPRGPVEKRNLGDALEYARTHFFTSEAGSRAEQGYGQYLVVLSGKDSDDPVYKPTRRIKSDGITVIGMSLGASMDEINVIATAPYIFQSISNAVPRLKAIFENAEEETIFAGKKLFNYTLVVKIHPSITPMKMLFKDVYCYYLL